MTNKEIIKALEGAILNAKKCDSKVWSIELYKLENALDLINRQYTELEDLREIVFMDRSEAIKNLKSEVIKEFAEKLKDIYRVHDGLHLTIDNLVKEIVGDTE